MREYRLAILLEVGSMLEEDVAVISNNGARINKPSQFCSRFNTMYVPCRDGCSKVPCAVLETEWELRCRPTTMNVDAE